MIFIVACLAVMIPVLLGGLFAWVTAGMDTRVKNTIIELEEKDKGYNPALTLNHKIKAQADTELQMKEARQLAAKRAASLPRGANMRIGRLGQENLNTAGNPKSLEADPVTAVRIANFHGWDGAKTGAVAVSTAPAAAAAPTAAATAGEIELVPGKDYPVIEITDDMSPEEKRKARIANSKAKSAAMKAAKAAGVPAAAVAAPAGAAVAAAPAAATAVSIEPPVYIEITDDMEPQERSKARIANSKAKSAFNKALKAAGIDPNDVEIVDGQVVIPGGAPAATPAAAPVAAAPAPAPTAAADPSAAAAIPKPEYIEITDDMDPQDKAKARIANSKTKSAYNKALKAAGIDPKSVQ